MLIGYHDEYIEKRQREIENGAPLTKKEERSRKIRAEKERRRMQSRLDAALNDKRIEPSMEVGDNGEPFCWLTDDSEYWVRYYICDIKEGKFKLTDGTRTTGWLSNIKVVVDKKGMVGGYFPDTNELCVVRQERCSNSVGEDYIRLIPLAHKDYYVSAWLGGDLYYISKAYYLTGCTRGFKLTRAELANKYMEDKDKIAGLSAPKGDTGVTISVLKCTNTGYRRVTQEENMFRICVFYDCFPIERYSGEHYRMNSAGISIKDIHPRKKSYDYGVSNYLGNGIFAITEFKTGRVKQVPFSKLLEIVNSGVKVFGFLTEWTQNFSWGSDFDIFFVKYEENNIPMYKPCGNIIWKDDFVIGVKVHIPSKAKSIRDICNTSDTTDTYMLDKPIKLLV